MFIYTNYILYTSFTHDNAFDIIMIYYLVNSIYPWVILQY